MAEVQFVRDYRGSGRIVLPPAEPDRFNHLPGQAWAITELIVTRYSGERPLFAAMRMRRALSLIKPSASFWL